MAIKNLFARGIGFANGLISWVVTHGFGAYSGSAPPSILAAGGELDAPVVREEIFDATPACLLFDASPAALLTTSERAPLLREA